VLYVKTPRGENASWRKRKMVSKKWRHSRYREIDAQEMGDRIAQNHLG